MLLTQSIVPVWSQSVRAFVYLSFKNKVVPVSSPMPRFRLVVEIRFIFISMEVFFNSLKDMMLLPVNSLGMLPTML